MRSGFVALAGRPNAGKSTLLNALMQKKLAIISEKPSTTRNQIRGILTKEDFQIVFTDTPGIHKPHHVLESRMNKEASGVVHGTDLVYLVVDGSVPYSSGDEFVLNLVKDAHVPVFLILNKIDKVPKEKVLLTLQSWQQRFDFAQYFPISARFQTSFEDLVQTTVSYLPEGEPFYPAEEISDEPENFHIAEIIREKILQCTQEEVPHSTAVVIESKTESAKGLEIQAVILVEKDGQKGILIGKQGLMLKKIGTAARKDMEEWLKKKVYLSLYVKVEPDWRDKDGKITSFGYGGLEE